MLRKSPAAVQICTLMGEEIHCACGRDGPNIKQRSNRHVIDVAIRQYALEGQCFVVNSCMYIDNSTVPPDFFGNAAWVYFGGSGIVNPMGEYVADQFMTKKPWCMGKLICLLIFCANLFLTLWARRTVGCNLACLEQESLRAFLSDETVYTVRAQRRTNY